MKKQDKKIKVYNVYEELKNGDLKNIFSLDTLEDLKAYIETDKSINTIKSMISQKKKIDNKYIIYIDYIMESEFFINDRI